MRGKGGAEWLLLLVVDASNHEFERTLSSTDGAHGMVDTSGAKSTLDDLETTSFTKYHVGGWDTDIVKGDVGMAMRSIVEAVDMEHTVDSKAGCISRDQDNGLLLVRIWVIWVGLSHDDVNLASRVTRTGRPPFLNGKIGLV